LKRSTRYSKLCELRDKSSISSNFPSLRLNIGPL
jgi:hypothetical protein